MLEQLVRILVDAGAEPLAAVKAAVILDAGGTIRQAAEQLDLRSDPLEFDPTLLLFEALLTEQAGLEAISR